MKVSVLIPAYNCAGTIAATLDSVLQQTEPADEVLVMDDGSTDETPNILKDFGPRITVFRQENAGLSHSRNALISRAQGDLIAFLDSDDIWHPRYLETQRRVFLLQPDAAASFLDHTNFCGMGGFQWDESILPVNLEVLTIEIFEPLKFARRFWTAPGPFVMSFACVPKKVLDGMREPFKLRVSEDVYFCSVLPFWGSVAYVSSPPLGAYRIREGSLASNRLNCAAGEIIAFGLVQEQYRGCADARLISEFEAAFASKRRALAKILLGVGSLRGARQELWRSLSNAVNATSFTKSLALLSASYLPKRLQPKWPTVERQWKPPQAATQS